jgi:hypothetical protein
MSRELRINGERVDLADSTQVALTRQANNIAELQNRQGDFSNQFTLPFTATNREVMEHAQIVNAGTDIPYRRLEATYTEDGVQLVNEGVATLVGASATGYTVQVNSGNTSFFGKFPDLKVSELIGNAFDHINNFANVTTSRTNTTGYIYPLINWFNESDPGTFQDGEIDARYLLPCIFIKDIFALVDELTGFTSGGALLDLPDFDNLILTPNTLQRGQDAQALYNASAKNTASQVFLVGTDNGAPTIVNYTPTLDEYSGLFVGNLFTPDAGLFGYFVFSGAISIKYKEYASLTRIIRIKIQFVKTAGLVVVAEELIFNFPTPLNPLEQEITFEIFPSVITSNITFTLGDTYYIRLYVEDTLKSEVTIQELCEFRFSTVDVMPYGGFMPVGELYEGITVKQVYQDVMNMYASTPQANSFHGTASFGLFEELEANKPSAKDWSEKVQPSGNSLAYKFGKYGQTNFLKYQPHDTVTAGFGDSSFAISDETLPDIVTAVQLATTATEETVGFQNQNYPRIKAVENTTRAFSSVNHRILLLNRQTVAYTHEYTDGATSLVTGASIPYATFAPLAFDVLKPLYYSVLLGMLFKTKAPAYTLKLSRQDVQELDYLIPIYLDVHTESIDVTGYFYLNQISNYLNGFGRCEFVRL